VAALETARSAARRDLLSAPSTSRAVMVLNREEGTCSRGSRDSSRTWISINLYESVESHQISFIEHYYFIYLTLNISNRTIITNLSDCPPLVSLAFELVEVPLQEDLQQWACSQLELAFIVGEEMDSWSEQAQGRVLHHRLRF
jgi:hypothetical protein